MKWYNDIWKIIKSSKPSVCRAKDGGIEYRDGFHFSGMSLDKHKEIVDIMTEHQRQSIEEITGKKPITADQIQDSVAQAAAPLSSFRLRNANPGDVSKMVERVVDSMLGGSDPIATPGANLNRTPQFDSMVTPNLWIDPAAAATIYAGGGLPAYIINKKAKSVRYNDVRIVNTMLDASDMERVNENAERHGLPRAMADGERDGLTYGGAIAFPMFKRETPASMVMGIDQLMALDIVGKDCIDRYVVLDRNNAIHIPQWNPTAADFLNPKYYFIPYLGGDVSGMRCARVVPIPQAGYWGALMTMGWGVSDIQGWFKDACQYELVAGAVPSLFQQISILVRTFNVDLANALNGSVTLQNVLENDTLAIHEASNENPINMDVIGDVKAIQRDFTAVAELLRTVRQNVAMKANIPEEQFWSSDRGAFSSGDQTDGMNERQWEGVRFVHDETADRCKKLGMLEIISTLGKDRDIRKALPYTRIVMLPPKIENAEKRSTIVSQLAAACFDLVASGVPADSALSIVLPYGDPHLDPTDAVLKKINEYQKKEDAKKDKEHELDMKLKQKEIDAPDEAPAASGGKTSSASSEKKGYSPLEQRKHETTRGSGSRREGLQRARGKKL
jgi:hypothetical protein